MELKRAEDLVVAQDKIVDFNQKKTDLLKRHFGKELSQEELDLFGCICEKTGLDPFLKQIYPVKRKAKQQDGSYRENMVVQVGVDGLRLIAERSGRYAPGRETSYVYDNQKKIISATSYIKKMTPDGQWHEVSATAFMEEYQPKYGGNFWEKMPHLMIGKCAESLAIRKAFPAETSKLYTHEEMQQAEIEPPVTIETDEEMISTEQEKEIMDLLAEDMDLYNKVLNGYKVEKLTKIPARNFQAIKRNIQTRKSM